MKAIIISLLIFKLFLSCSSPPKVVEENSEFIPNHARIIAKPVIGLKENPDEKSKILDSIPENYIVFAIQRTKQKENREGVEDYWYKTKFKNKTGWLFGKYLIFEEKETSTVKLVQSSLKNPNYPVNFTKIRKFFTDNMFQKNYNQVMKEYGKPKSEAKYKGSNPHGGYNNYQELVYPDLRFKFIDQVLFDITYFTSEKLKNKAITIDSELQELELEFETPYYISKDVFSYLTCFPHTNECPTGYPNTVSFQIKNQKVKSIRLTLYLD